MRSRGSTNISLLKERLSFDLRLIYKHSAPTELGKSFACDVTL